MRETKMITMRTFDKDGVLGAWEGDWCLVVWVKGSNNGDTPIEHHVQHPLIHPSVWANYSFLGFGHYTFLDDTQSRRKFQCHEKHFSQKHQKMMMLLDFTTSAQSSVLTIIIVQNT